MLSFAEYKTLGGTLEETAYERVSFGVFADIDRCTFGRVSKLSPMPEAVKRLIVELCAIAAPYNTDTDDAYRQHKVQLIYSYLSCVCTADGTPLLYRGVDA
nr:MAG TPA: head-tail connector protein [Caudoviricetes sp.]